MKNATPIAMVAILATNLLTVGFMFWGKPAEQTDKTDATAMCSWLQSPERQPTWKTDISYTITWDPTEERFLVDGVPISKKKKVSGEPEEIFCFFLAVKPEMPDVLQSAPFVSCYADSTN